MKSLRMFRIITLFIVALAITCLSIGLVNLVGEKEEVFLGLGGAIAFTAVGGFCGFISFFLVVFVFLVPGLGKIINTVQEDINGNNNILKKATTMQYDALHNDTPVQEPVAQPFEGERAPLMSYCRHCGKRIEADSRFCKY